MQSLGDYAADIKRTLRATARSHRKAFGSQRPTPPAQRAQYVAESIAQREDEGRAWDYTTYGIEDNLLMQRLVEAKLAKLAQLQWTEAEAEQLAAWYYEQEQMRLEALEALEDGR